MSGPASLALRVVAGPQAGDEFPLAQGDTVVGRLEGTAITLTDVRVARRHAHVERAGDEVVVVDHGTVNGTFVEGERLVEQQPRRLAVGHRFTVGDTVLELVRPAATG